MRSAALLVVCTLACTNNQPRNDDRATPEPAPTPDTPAELTEVAAPVKEVGAVVPPAAVVAPAAVVPAGELPPATLVPPSPLPAAPQASTSPGVQDLPADTPLPRRARKTTKLVAGKRFTDSNGDNFVFLLAQEVVRPGRDSTVSMYAYGVVRDGKRERALWHWREVESGCMFRNVSGLLPTSLTITDLDGDGLAETSWTHVTDCLTVARPLDLVRRSFEGADSYSLSGHATAAGLEPAPTFTPDRVTWPTRLADAATLALTTSAATIATPALAGLPTALSDQLVPPPQTVAIRERRVDRTFGEFRVEVTYPELRFKPSSAAARLNAQITAFVRPGARYDATDVGFHEAECTAHVATSQLLDVECRIMVDIHTRQQIADATGGSPGDYTRLAVRVWLLPELPAVDIMEILGEVAIVGGCAPLLTTGAYRLGAEGLVWELRFGSDPQDDPPPGCDAFEAIAYDQMKPRTARARAFVAGMLAPSDPDATAIADTDTDTD